MDLEEVKQVWNKVIPDIRSFINVTELLDYLGDIFSTTSCQKIAAQDKQYGSSTASSEFFEEAKRKPSSFPVILFALKKIQQLECLIKILETILQEIKPSRHEEVFRFIRTAGAGDRFRSVNIEEEIRRAYQSTSSPSHVASTDGGRGTLPNTIPPLAAAQTNEVIYRRQPNSNSDQGCCSDVLLGKLKSSGRAKISKSLNALCPDGKTPVWLKLLDSEDLDIDSAKAREIEKSLNSGKEFFDQLSNLEYTTTDLIHMLENHSCVHAATTVEEQSRQVPTPRFKQDLTNFDENNLNLAKQRTTVQQQTMLNIQGVVGSSSNMNRGASIQSEAQTLCGDSVEVVLGELEDSTKGTQGVEAVSDRDNTKSTLPPDGERQKLVKDRVGQHKGDEDNLESFNDLRKTSEKNKDVQSQDEPPNVPQFRSVSSLDQPELVQQQQQLESNNSDPQLSSSADSNMDNTKKIFYQEHVEGPTYYQTQLDSLHKLHDDRDASPLVPHLSAVSLEDNEQQSSDTGESATDAIQETSDDGFTNIQKLTKQDKHNSHDG